jgi:alkaline phosphatase D
MIVGGVTAHEAKVFVRTDAAAQVAIQYSTSPAFTTPLQTAPVSNSAASHFTTIFEIGGLAPETRYYYRALVDGTPLGVGHSFSTFPVEDATRTFSFAVFADLENGASNPTRSAPAYAAAAANNPAFVMQIGDFDHRNPTSLAAMRSMHRQIRNDSTAEGRDFAASIAPHFPFFHIWDDHDYGKNDGDKNFAGRAAALQAFNEYYPTPGRPNPAGIWHSFEYAQAEIFMLDVRSQADPRLDPDGPAKSMLDGDNIPNGQLDWLKDGLLNSTARWKFIVSGVTFNPGTKPYDAWGGYQRERQEILDFIRVNNIEGVIVVSGDLHTGGALDDGANAGLPEVSVPHTNLPVSLPSSGIIGTWSEGYISGIGGDGYTLITVSADRVLIENRGANGAVRQQMSVGIPLDPPPPPPPSAGLFGEYFNSVNLTNLAGTRVDPTISFKSDWGPAPPGTAVSADDVYSARWTGFVETAAAGAWTFYTTSNDGVRLWVDDQLIINNWTTHAVVQNSGTLTLATGWHSIRLEYFQQAGLAEVTLSFQGPGQPKTIIPQSKLRTAPPDPPPPPEAGLLGTYFNAANLTLPAGTRVDPTVNFKADWGPSPPGTGVTADDLYSVRWTGAVETSTAGVWTFYTTSNDGVRLWIGEQLIINNWTTHAVVQNSGAVTLAAGWHPIRLEYFQQAGVAEVTFSFEGPAQAKAIIPQAKMRTGMPSQTLLATTAVNSLTEVLRIHDLGRPASTNATSASVPMEMEGSSRVSPRLLDSGSVSPSQKRHILAQPSWSSFPVLTPRPARDKRVEFRVVDEVFRVLGHSRLTPWRMEWLSNVEALWPGCA